MKRPALTDKRTEGLEVLLRHIDRSRIDGRLKPGLFRIGRTSRECDAARAGVDYLEQLVEWKKGQYGEEASDDEEANHEAA